MEHLQALAFADLAERYHQSEAMGSDFGWQAVRHSSCAACLGSHSHLALELEQVLVR